MWVISWMSQHPPLRIHMEDMDKCNYFGEHACDSHLIIRNRTSANLQHKVYIRHGEWKVVICLYVRILENTNKYQYCVLMSYKCGLTSKKLLLHWAMIYYVLPLTHSGFLLSFSIGSHDFVFMDALYVYLLTHSVLEKIVYTYIHISLFVVFI